MSWPRPCIAVNTVGLAATPTMMHVCVYGVAFQKPLRDDCCLAAAVAM